MPISLGSSGVNGVAASPLVISVTVALNNYLAATFATDAATGNTTYESPLVELVKNTSTADGQSFYASGGRASGSDTSLSFTNDASTLVGIIAAFSGVDTTTALDVTFNSGNHSKSSNTAVSNTSANSISLTTVTAGAMIVVMIGWDVTSTSDPTTAINDGGAGLTWNYLAANESGGFRKSALAYAIKPTAGSITLYATTTVSAGYGIAVIALRPTAGGAQSIAWIKA